MNLILDIGNTSAKYSLVESNKIVWTFSEPSVQRESVDRIVSRFAPCASIVSSTGGNASEVGEMLSESVDRVIVMTHETPVPIGIQYDSKQTLGTDRIALAVGVATSYGFNDALIVDIGTAITFDVLRSGVFEGGNISLGVEMRTKALNHYTYALPKVDLTDAICEENVVFGTSTITAIREGVLQGVAMEIEGYMAALERSGKNFHTVICGGGAKCFVNRIKNAIFANYEVSVIGLNAILEYNEH